LLHFILPALFFFLVEFSPFSRSVCVSMCMRVGVCVCVWACSCVVSAKLSIVGAECKTRKKQQHRHQQWHASWRKWRRAPQNAMSIASPAVHANTHSTQPNMSAEVTLSFSSCVSVCVCMCRWRETGQGRCDSIEITVTAAGAQGRGGGGEQEEAAEGSGVYDAWWCVPTPSKVPPPL
jgi:hypothetical protein